MGYLRTIPKCASTLIKDLIGLRYLDYSIIFMLLSLQRVDC